MSHETSGPVTDPNLCTRNQLQTYTQSIRLLLHVLISPRRSCCCVPNLSNAQSKLLLHSNRCCSIVFNSKLPTNAAKLAHSTTHAIYKQNTNRIAVDFRGAVALSFTVGLWSAITDKTSNVCRRLYMYTERRTTPKDNINNEPSARTKRLSTIEDAMCVGAVKALFGGCINCIWSDETATLGHFRHDSALA